MNSILSIITVCRNNKDGLVRTANSVIRLKESLEKSCIEWIIIDGASTDDTVQYLKDNKDVIDFYISEPDCGIYDAMNKGVKVSKGDYLIFLNAGDVLSDEAFSFDLTTLQKESYDMYYCSAYLKTQEGFIEKKYPKELTVDFFFLDSLCHQSIFFKRALFEKSLYDDSYRLASDLDFIMKCIFEYRCKYLYLQFPICYYEGGGYSDIHYYDIAKKERREIISKYLEGREYWYDAIILRKELDDENLFSLFQFFPYRKSFTGIVRSVISLLVKLYKITRI